MPVQPLSYEKFKEARAKSGKTTSRERYQAFLQKWALAHMSDSEEDASEEEEPAPPIQKKKAEKPGAHKNSAVSAFEQALAAAGEAEKGATQLSRAQTQEARAAPRHRRAIYGKKPKEVCFFLCNLLVCTFDCRKTTYVENVLRVSVIREDDPKRAP